MFTGIIEEIGKVEEFTRHSMNARLKISCRKILNDTKIGDSIAVNGCCQTVTEKGNNYFISEVSLETLNITNFVYLKPGVPVNLERALTPSSRMGGHIVQGHIDCTGKITDIEQLTNFYNMTFELPEENMRYVVVKGSIAINGISLTVAKVNFNNFTAAIIPHTYSNTVLKTLRVGDSVNIETDILGRYVEKFLSLDDNNKELDENFLKENGFI